MSSDHFAVILDDSDFFEAPTLPTPASDSLSAPSSPYSSPPAAPHAMQDTYTYSSHYICPAADHLRAVLAASSRRSPRRHTSAATAHKTDVRMQVCPECKIAFAAGSNRKYCTNECSKIVHRRQVLLSQRNYKERMNNAQTAHN